MRIAFSILLTLIISAFMPLEAQLVQKSAVFDGLERVWFEHVPSVTAPRLLPLVIALHGSGDSADHFAAETGWPAVADRAGFIAVFPNASDSVGNIWNIFFLARQPDDVEWLRSLIERLERDLPVDRARIFLTGFSNGASMVSTFAGVHSDLVTALAPVSGHWITAFYPAFLDPESALQPSGPIPVWIFRGELETFVTGSQPRPVQDQNAKQFWMMIDGVAPTPVIVRNPPYTTEIYSGKAEVRFTEIAGLGHQVDPNTSVMIWEDFFSRFGNAPSGRRRAVRLKQ